MSGHMEAQIVRSDWYEVETANGTEIVPADLLVHGSAPESYEGEPYSAAGNAILVALAQYTEREPRSYMMRRNAIGGRLSAPGYLDCTPWALYASEEEARADLEEDGGEG